MKHIRLRRLAGGLFALAIASIAFTASASPQDIRFQPKPGDEREYRVGIRIQTEPDDDSVGIDSQTMIAQSLLRYRVDTVEPTLKIHVDSRFMQIELQGGNTFSSARADTIENNPVAALMQSGFDLIMDRDEGTTQLDPVDRDAWQALRENAAGASAMDQIAGQIAAPSTPKRLPARKGAQITLDDFHGMPPLVLTVESVSRDNIVAVLAAADGAPAASSGDGPPPPRLSVHGRMKLDRDSGWIQALTLVSNQRTGSGSYAGTVHSVATMTLVDDPATGSAIDNLAEFSAGASDFESELALPQTPAEAKSRPWITPTPEIFANADTIFTVDQDKNELALRVRYHLAEPDKAALGNLTLNSITLRDAQDRIVDIPLVLESMEMQSWPEPAHIIRLLPLGWQAVPLDRIDHVEATLGYRPLTEPSYVSLPLADQPTELHAGKASARATPSDDGWRLALSGTDDHGYLYDLTKSFAGLTVRTTNKAHDGVRASDRTLLERVDTPDIFINELVVRGDRDQFPLALFEYPTATQHELVFDSLASRFADRTAPAPAFHDLPMSDTPESQSLSLESIETEGAASNALRLNLPRGVGEACQLTGVAGKQHGHALVWRPANERPAELIDDPFALADGVHKQWRLMTDDGIQTVFYGIDVATVLRCPGQPRWQTEPVDTQDDTPWLIDVQAIANIEIDPAESAAHFFEHVRFVDRAGVPIRPMLKNATADDELADWADESRAHALGDYLYDDGQMRFWGRVDAVQAIEFSGEPIERLWTDHLGRLQ